MVGRFSRSLSGEAGRIRHRSIRARHPHRCLSSHSSMPAVGPGLSGMSSKSRARRRRGIALIEIIVVLVLFGVLGVAIGVTLIRQQRFYRGASELLQAREGVRDAMEVLSADIRGMSATDTVR